MYFLLIFLLIVFFLFNMSLFKKDIFCPPVALNLTFLFCVSFGLLMYREWDLSHYGWQAVVCIIGGLSVFSTVSYAMQSVFYQNGSVKHGMRVYRNRINVSNSYFLLAISSGLIVLDISLTYIRKAVSLHLNLITLPNMLSVFRGLMNVGKISLSIGILMLRQIFGILAVVSMFIFLHNVCFGVKQKKDLLHFAVIVIGVTIQSVLAGGGRLNLLSSASMCFYMFLFFLNMRYGFNNRINKKVLRYGILGFCVLLTLFLVLIVAFGRSKSLMDIDFRAYLSTYIAGGIRNLDLYFQAPTYNVFPGSETFTALLKRIVPQVKGSRIFEFRDVSGVNTGNIYTSFRRFYSDFHFMGVLVLTAVQAFVTSSLYFGAKKDAKKGELSFLILLFCYFSDTLFFIAIEDTFYSTGIGIGSLIRLSCLYCLYRYFIKQDIVFSYGKHRLI